MNVATDPTTTTELATGWEAGAPIGDSVLRRFVFAYADRVEQMARRAGRRVEGDADARFADVGSPFHVDNAVVLLRPPTDLRPVVARARAFFSGPWVLLSAWPTGDLSGLGVSLVGHPPLMFRPPSPWPAAPSGLRIEEVRGTARLGDFERTLAAGFPLRAPLPGDGGSIFDRRLVGGVLRLFVGYAGGEPVSVAGAAVNHGLVEIDWVATLPHARGRGYGAALTAAAGAIAPEVPAVLLATDPGRPVYRRLGFFDLLRATMWEGQP
jgi:GNAT superfamily N-acetyltransferase